VEYRNRFNTQDYVPPARFGDMAGRYLYKHAPSAYGERSKLHITTRADASALETVSSSVENPDQISSTGRIGAA